MLDVAAGVVLAFRGAAGTSKQCLSCFPREGLRCLPAMARWLGGTALCCRRGVMARMYGDGVRWQPAEAGKNTGKAGSNSRQRRQGVTGVETKSERVGRGAQGQMRTRGGRGRRFP